MKALRKAVALLIILAMALSFAGFTNKPTDGAVQKEDGSARDPHEKVSIIVKLKDEPVLKSFSINDVRSNEKARLLREKQDDVIGKITKTLMKGEEVKVRYHYAMLFNGFSMEAEYGLIEEIKKLPEVADAYENWSYELPEEPEPDGEADRLLTSVGFINADDLWSLGYTGQGQTVAVIDTGIKKDHPNFAAAPQNPHFSVQLLQSILDNNELCAEESFTDGTLTAQDLYYSSKIPFGFNYYSGNLDVSHADGGSDHGTHVSSICAGNDSNARGVAYNAQIISMQVFKSGRGYWDCIIAALEDCAMLGVDAVNMSLGSACGYAHDEELDPVFDLLIASGVNISASCGNSSYVAATGSELGMINPTFNFDNGVTGYPGTSYGCLSVAASEKSSSANPASYSSWGTTSDLCIKPEIMAPGNRIKAATDPDYSGVEYNLKSGTSMSAPHIAGGMLLINQYVNANFPNLTEQQKMEMVNTLLMCTAVPSKTNNTPYSPRVQGAGQADLLAAITTKAYIDVPGCVRPKLEIGDDDDKTGVFTLTFDVVNFGNTRLSYTVSPTVLLESTTARTVEGVDSYLMSHTPENVTSRVRIQKPNTVTVPAGGRTTVTVTVDVNAIADEINEKWPLGAYIEGFVMLSGAVDLSIPFLGFYGDWEYAAALDRSCYFDSYLGIDRVYPEQWGTNTAFAVMQGREIEFGLNPFGETRGFLLDRASISPNGDGKMDCIESVYTYVLRTLNLFRYEIIDADTGEQYYVKDIDGAQKAYSSSFQNPYYPMGAEDWSAIEQWYGDGLPNGTSVILRMTGWMPGFDEFDPNANEFASWEIPITIDTEAPHIEYWQFGGGVLQINVSDNHYTAHVGVYSDPSCNNLIAEELIEEYQRGALSMLSFSVGSYSTVYVKVSDYAANSIVQTVTVGSSGAFIPVDLTAASLNNTSVVLNERSIAVLNVIREPANANNFETRWESANPNIATVTGGNTNANVIGVSEGSTTVTAHVRDKRTNRTFDLTATIEVNDFPTFEEAANVAGETVTYVTGGDYPWVVDFVDGSPCVKNSNQRVDSSQSVFQTVSLNLEAGDKFTFRWKVSSETNCDYFKFFVNGAQKLKVSGPGDWETYEFTVPVNGSYVFKWSYEKDSLLNDYDDTVWVDDVRIIRVHPIVTAGDINNNGTVDSSDALLALRFALGAIALTPTQQQAADVDGSGTVTSADALLILRLAMGVISAL